MKTSTRNILSKIAHFLPLGLFAVLIVMLIVGAFADGAAHTTLAAVNNTLGYIYAAVAIVGCVLGGACDVAAIVKRERTGRAAWGLVLSAVNLLGGVLILNLASAFTA